MQLFYNFKTKLYLNKFYIKHFIIFYSVGLIGHVLYFSRPYMFIITPFFLLFFGLFSLSPYFIRRNTGVIIFTLLATTLTFIIEVIGVKTGLIFGEYAYIDNLGFFIFEVPPIIGFNWVLIILGSAVFSKKVTESVLIQPFITAILAVFFDWVMEPVAISFSYWQWESSLIPIQNYLAWFCIAFIFSIPIIFFKLKLSKISFYYFVTQLVYFLLLRFFILFSPDKLKNIL